MKRTIFSLTLLVAATVQGFAQEAQNTRNSADQTLRSTGTVNPSTLGLEMNIPLGGYQGRGITLPIGLNYTSKLWRFDTRAVWLTPYAEPGSGARPIHGNTWTYVYPKYAEDSASGWTSTISQPYVEYTGRATWFNCIGTPITSYASSSPCSPFDQGSYIRRITIRLPDGSHELRDGDGPISGNPASANWNGVYKSVDGSGVKYVEDSTASIYRIYMPDGSLYDLSQSTEPSNSQDFPATIRRATRLTDINGNYVTFNSPDTSYPNGSITDTLGRTFPVVIPHEAPTIPDDPGYLDQEFVLTGMDPNTPYKFRWKRLGNAFTPDRNHQLSYRGGTNLNFANPGSYSPSLFAPNDLMSECTYDVLKILGNPSAGGVGTPSVFNPGVLSEITLPNGAKYEFTYNAHGEVETIRYPAGAHEEFTHTKVASLGQMAKPYQDSNRGVVERKVYENDAATPSTWTYQADNAAWQYRTTVVAPDGTRVERYMHRGIPPLQCSEHDPGEFPNNEYGLWWGYDNVLAGRAFNERTFSSANQLIQRTLTGWTTATNTNVLMTVAPERPVQLNPRMLWTETRTYDGTAGVSAAAKLEYHTGEDLPGSPLNVRYKKEYAYTVVSDGNLSPGGTLSNSAITLNDPSVGQTPVRITETTFKTETDYINRNLLRLPIEMKVTDGATTPNVLAKTQTSYDEGGDYAIINAGTDNQWLDPNSDVRGNATTTKTWVKETDTWLLAHAQYDNFGNLRKAWDASGDANKYVETQFSPTYKYAYPTSVTAPAPDPTNTTGTNQTSTVSTTYDFNTGLPLSVTDDFGQVTTTEYNDPLLRPTKVNPVVISGSPTGPVAKTIYDDDELTVTVRKQLDGVNWDEATTFMDALGRAAKTVAKDSQGDVIVETHYDHMGRVDRVTNPYRAGDTVYWNKTRYDEAGRAVETYAPETLANLANAQSLGITSFGISTLNNGSGNFIGTVVTTTDASGRKGRSITNALGQLIRVDEPTGISTDPNADLGPIDFPIQPTYYTYDVFGKMVKVVQGVQTRYFKYDALGRLLRINQPEQERNPNLDLSDSFNSTGFWTAGFAYDVLGNVVRATDANGVNIINEYDRASRVTKRCYTKPNISTTATTCAQIVSSGYLSLDTPTVTFFYDGKGVTEQTPNFAKGKLTKVDNTYSQTRYTSFDNFGRLTQMEQRTPLDGENTATTTARVSSYQYNLSGALTQETYPSGRVVKNEFESDGDLMNVASKKAGGTVFTPYVSNFLYTASGGISQMKLGNGKWETAKFNNRMQVTELGLGASATDAGTWKVAYEYGELDSNGNTVTSKNTGNIAKQTLSFTGLANPLVQAYKYDPLYRLIEARETANGNQNWIQNWTYDLYGNRAIFTQNIAGNTSAANPSVDPNKNRFYLGQGFVYDKNGNVTQDVDPVSSQNRTFVFNGDNKQAKVRDANNNVVGEYFYDGEGKRIKKYVPSTGETTIFVYSSGKLVAEYSTVVEPPETAKVAYTTTDHLGSPRVITDQFGQVRSRRDFLPFGESVNINVGARSTALNYGSSTDNVRQKFTGYQKDNETSLDFAEARMYENRFGRFTAVDPLLASGKSANPQTFNRFVYVGNNPVLITDPSGLDWFRQNRDGRTHYQWFDKNPGDDWSAVNFGGNAFLRLDNDFCGGGVCGKGAGYIYLLGGWDRGERAARMQDLGNFFATFSGVDPKQLAARDPSVRGAGADVIGGITGFGINSVTGTYNFAAGGVNYFSGSEQLPYAWEYTPETGGQRAFYYGAMGLTGGYAAAGTVRGIASGVNTIRSGGLSFSAYRAAQGPSEILGSVKVMTRSGRDIPFAIRTEQSHMFITQAMQRKHNLPNWLVNNRINVWKLNTIQHALVDPARFRTLPVGLKPQVGWIRNRFTFFSNDF